MELSRKELGNWGEGEIDQFMAAHDWQTAAKNLRIPRGEIDRIYFKECSSVRQYCVAEVKTTNLTNAKFLAYLLSSSSLERFLKARQAQNIARIGEQIALRAASNKTTWIHLRLFLVIRFTNEDGNTQLPNLPFIPGKVCANSRERWIMSFQPEFTSSSTSTGKLQIPLPT